MGEQQKPAKKKNFFKEALFGGKGTSGELYKIIYFSVYVIMNDKGPEQQAVLLYGDDTSIYNLMMPLMNIRLTYNNELDGAYIKINRSWGGNKAELFIPFGYSFMAPALNAFVEAIPQQAIPIVQETIEEEPIFEREEEYAGPTYSQPEVAKPIVEETYTPPVATPAQETRPQKRIQQKDVIADQDSFSVTFDSDSMNEKIDRFMKYTSPKPTVNNGRPTEIDTRTIDEIKQEAVQDEIERLTKNNKRFTSED